MWFHDGWNGNVDLTHSSYIRLITLNLRLKHVKKYESLYKNLNPKELDGLQFKASRNSGVANSIIGGGHMDIYSCFAQLVTPPACRA